MSSPLPKGNAIRRNFPGMIRGCARCDDRITVTEQMCKYGKYICGQCQSAGAAAWARTNRERKRAHNNIYHSRHSADRADTTRRYRDRHPQKKAAHQAVQTALRNGSLIRGACEVCGVSRVHAHHSDYSKPLDVNWLCHEHHMEVHLQPAMMIERAKRAAR